MNGQWKKPRVPSSFGSTGVLLLLFLTLPPLNNSSWSPNNPHVPQKLTWQVLSGSGEIVYQITDVKPPGTWWPPLTPDICALAVGDKNWHIGKTQISLQESRAGTDIRYDLRPAWKGPNSRLKGILCNNGERRKELQNLPFYVCPAFNQKPKDIQLRSSPLSCGRDPRNDYHCQIWGCETTGTGGWISQPGWELIRVKRNQTTFHPYPGWINPLNITFTTEGSKKSILHKWMAGMWWGLRLYKTAEDDGVLFNIRLRVESANPPTPLGPGLAPPPSLARRPPQTHSKVTAPAPLIPTETLGIGLTESGITEGSPRSYSRIF